MTESKKDLIKKYLDIWTYRLGLRWWHIEARFIDDPTTIIRTFTDPEDVLARTTVRWEYAQAVISFNIPAWDDVDDDEIEEYVIHELCHVLVNEMQEGETHHEERVVTSLAKAFLWTVADVEKGEKNGSTVIPIESLDLSSMESLLSEPPIAVYGVRPLAAGEVAEPGADALGNDGLAVS